MSAHSVRTLSLAGAAGLLLALSAPLAASAHVTVDPGSAEPGSYTVLTVKVPNESATAATNRVELRLPTDTPFSSVRYVPVPGWSAELVTTTLPEPVTVGESEIAEAVTSVVWTAQAGSEIGQGQLQQFDLSVGPVPDTGSITLPAVQSYTDGEVVEWTETAADAEHPAPVLYITDAPADAHAGHDADADADTDAATVTASDDDAASSAASRQQPVDVLARVFSILGLVVGIVGVALAVTSRRTAVN
ncbi:YcnI family protein [Microbacteriaceae bacterium 4G12]